MRAGRTDISNSAQGADGARRPEGFVLVDPGSYPTVITDQRAKALPFMSSLDNSEAYLLLLLSDSNLPTGSFVASSGLESFLKHGFSSSTRDSNNPSTSSINTTTIVTFIQDSLSTYASSALPFVSDAYAVVSSSGSSSETLDRLKALDDLYDSMTLNHVTKRASKAQGVALLTLYSKGFSRPPGFSALPADASAEQMAKLVDAYKLRVRSETAPGHLPVCWGILCAALCMSLGRWSFSLLPKI